MQTILLENFPNVVVVDDDDYPLVAGRRWYYSVGYALRHEYRDGKSSTVYMHRLILGAGAGQQVDHVNGNGLDNRRCNLRLCNQSLNNANRTPTRPAKSGFRGVYNDSAKNKRSPWRATIGRGPTKRNLGSFANAEDAARAYDAEAQARYGEFARLNFPNEAA